MFFMDNVAEYLKLMISDVRFPVQLSMNKHLTYYNEQFDGSLIKIYQILTI